METNLAIILIGLVVFVVILVLANRPQRRCVGRGGSAADAGPFWLGDSGGHRHDDGGRDLGGDGGVDGGGGDGGGGGD